MTSRYKADPSSYNRQLDETLPHYISRRLIAVKPIESLNHHGKKAQLSRQLRWWDLIFLGIGGIIGTGIFVLSGNAAATYAGPSVIISFILAALTSLLAAFSYSEMSTMIPISGSAYTYAYATMGELLAWVIGWDLILEYMVGAATVAVGWSAYFVTFFQVAFNVDLGTKYTSPPFYWNETAQSFGIAAGSGFNLPGFFIVILCTILLVIGIKESAWVNNVIVVIKLLIIVIFIFGVCSFVNPNNWKPFVPARIDSDWRHFGVGGIFAASTQIFFAYIGFDAVTTAALECKNTKRDLPIGIIGSLAISTFLYIIVALLMTGVVNYVNLGGAAPIATVAEMTGQKWLVIVVTLGALAGLSTVILISLLGQPRIFYTMSVDGLFPPIFSHVHPRFKTPWFPTILSGIITAFLGGFLPIDILGNLTSVGTLLAFLLVHISVIVLRFTRPDIPRPFAIPGYRFSWIIVPILGIITCVLLIAVSEVQTIWRLFVWLGIGLIIYGCYGFRHSTISEVPDEDDKKSNVELEEECEGEDSSLPQEDGETPRINT